jgi:hypothetical protein
METLMRQKILLAIASALALASSGCAMIDEVTRPAMPNGLAPRAVAYKNAMTQYTGAPLVILSYPSALTPGANARVRRAYIDNPIGSLPNLTLSERPQAFDEALLKTNYHVHEFYRILSARLPPGSVVLQPAFLDIRGSEASYMVPNEGIPAALRVDFMMYSHPRLYSNGRPWSPNSYARNLSPLMAIRISAGVASESRSDIAGMDDLPPMPAARGRQPSILLQFLAVSKSGKSKQKSRDYKNIPVVEYHIPDDKWLSFLDSGIDGVPPGHDLFSTYADIVVECLNTIETETAVDGEKAAYYSLYDANAASDSERSALLDQFIDAERQFVHEQGMLYSDNLYRGDFGSSMRERILAEVDTDEKAGRADKMAALSMGAGMLLGGLTNGLAGAATGGGSLANGYSTLADIAKISESFDSSFAEIGLRQKTVSVDLGNQERSIQAQTLDELRRDFRALYDERFPQSRAE